MMVSVKGLPVAVEQLKKKTGQSSNESLALNAGVATSTMRRYAQAKKSDTVRTHKVFVESFARYFKQVMKRDPELRILS